MIFVTCPKCHGRGKVESLIEDRLYTCHTCGGHQEIPADPAENKGKAAYYYQGINWKYGYKSQRIAILTVDINEPEKYRAQIYGPYGPSTHYTDPAQDSQWPIMHNLAGYTRADSFAARTLDAWSNTAFWKDGIKGLEYVSLDNLLRYYDVTRDLYFVIINQTKDRDERLRKFRALKRRYLSAVSLF